MEIVYVEALLMNNGEVISLGKTLGFDTKANPMKLFREVSKEDGKVLIEQIKSNETTS